MQTTYTTGRNYGTPQALRIETLWRGKDATDWTTVRFDDDARGIRGVVTVLDMEITLRDIGPAVLREYDGGRYRLI